MQVEVEDMRVAAAAQVVREERCADDDARDEQSRQEIARDGSG